MVTTLTEELSRALESGQLLAGNEQERLGPATELALVVP